MEDHQYRFIAGELRGHIEMGLYRPGEQLPSITRIGEMFDAKAGVVRDALTVLKDEGLVMVRNGDGHYVVPDTEGADLMAVTLVAVCESGAGIQQIAEHLRVSRWTIGRLLNGGITLTPEWSQKIIAAAEAIGRENNKIHTYE